MHHIRLLMANNFCCFNVHLLSIIKSLRGVMLCICAYYLSVNSESSPFSHTRYEHEHTPWTKPWRIITQDSSLLYLLQPSVPFILVINSATWSPFSISNGCLVSSKVFGGGSCHMTVGNPNELFLSDFTHSCAWWQLQKAPVSLQNMTSLHSRLLTLPHHIMFVHVVFHYYFYWFTWHRCQAYWSSDLSWSLLKYSNNKKISVTYGLSHSKSSINEFVS